MNHSTDIEYCNPFDQSNSNFWMKLEHLGRYQYAAHLAQGKDLKSALDVSCADGYGCIELAFSLKKVIGVDIVPEILVRAEKNVKQKRLENVQFFLCDLEKKNLSSVFDCYFDLITSFETLEHLSNPGEVLTEFNKLLNSDGYLLLSVPNAAYEPLTVEGKPRNPHHKQLFTQKEIIEIVKSKNFLIEEVLGQPYTNFFFNIERKMIKDGLYDNDWVASLYNQTEDSIRYFTKLFAWPEKNRISDSYSTIILARKR